MMAALRGRSLLWRFGFAAGAEDGDDDDEDVFAAEDFWASCSGTLMFWSAAGEGLAGREGLDEGSGGRPAMEVSGTPALRAEGMGSRV